MEDPAFGWLADRDTYVYCVRKAFLSLTWTFLISGSNHAKMYFAFLISKRNALFVLRFPEPTAL